MRREISAGGVVVAEIDGAPHIVCIQPTGRESGFWVLPKGRVDAGETMRQAAIREVREETGLDAEPTGLPVESRYVSTREGERVNKLGRFFPMRATGGTIDDIDDAMRVEVTSVGLVPVSDIDTALAYAGERTVVRRLLRLNVSEQ